MACVGLLGGCFNPIHNGHVRLALEMLEQLGLDRVELMPAAVPPHKPGEGMLSFARRVEMVRAAVDGIDGLGVNCIEAKRPGPSYTVDTLRLLRDMRPEDDFWFILGAGDLRVLPNWERGMEIPGLAHLAVSNRVEDDLEDVRAFVGSAWPDAIEDATGTWRFAGGRTFSFANVPRLDISSSQVREKWCAGRCVRALVPDGVERLMRTHAGELSGVWGCV